MTRYVFLIPLFVLLTGVPVFADPLEILYFERPPYYQTEGGEAQGLLIDRTKQVLQAAGIEAAFRSQPPLRIMAVLKENAAAACAVGWFRTEEREAFSQFSLPIYRDLPIQVLTLKGTVSKLEKLQTLHAIFADHSLVMAALKSFSYGAVIDGWLAEAAAAKVEIVGNQKQLPQIILRGRADYMLIAPEEKDVLLQAAGVSPQAFASITPGDSPPGNARHLMCNRAVSQQTLENINRAIQQLQR